MIRTLLTFLIIFSTIWNSVAQQQVTVMSYNVLNFPTGNIEGREDTLKRIIDHIEPDLFLIQELKSDSGLQLILNESFAGLAANYAATTYLPQQSNPSSNFKLQQAMVYNSDLFGLASEGYLQTAVRDLNKFKLYYKDPELGFGADTIFFYVFVVHLKSSQGTENVESRLSMAQTLSFHQQYLEAGANMIVAGDFNVYSSEEPAYQELLDASNQIVLRDPIDSPGDWNSSSFQPKSILTQSTRSSSIFNDGAGGGVDDRFDFILLSSDMFYDWNTIVYEPDSYYALGNTGTCYNQSITDCDGGVWSDELLQSLYYMSDHLPVILKLNFGVGTVSTSTPATRTSSIQLIDDQLLAVWDNAEVAILQVTDALGRSVLSKQVQLRKGENQITIPGLDSYTGFLVISLQSGTTKASLKRVFSSEINK